jgi:nitroimidazol reductase NimA-like FMN-containing flavoprotein (pyridoxamine 5'-phosphate oxidase superfamily)
MTKTMVSTRELDRKAIDALLSKHHVGFMAIAFHDHVTIQLVNYVYADDWIYARMERGPDLTAVRHHHWVAFEVSEVSGVYDWRTVSITGSVQLLTDGPAAQAAEQYQAAVARLRSAVPAVFTDKDPMPQRVQLFRLHVDEASGRESRRNAHGDLPAA